MEKSESIIELSKSLAQFQQEVKQPMKDADNPFFKSKYVPLESVVEAITNCAPKHGLSFVQYPCNNDDGRIGIATVVTHTSGEYMEFDPVFMKPEKDTPQGSSEGWLRVNKNQVEVVGVRNGKGDTGDYKKVSK
ncbi:ERF family protein, partial [Halobacillus karajensis]|uniref:ERF superfamily protein n=1 Tax=Halobacillus karajensis TaxID=195088 RepID=A0A059NWA5_9BACI